MFVSIVHTTLGVASRTVMLPAYFSTIVSAVTAVRLTVLYAYLLGHADPYGLKGTNEGQTKSTTR